MNEYGDCSMLWPTTTETPTEPAGCCYGDSYKANDKCAKMNDDRERCEKQGCNFLITDDPDDCIITTTTTTETPGCCKGNPDIAYSKRWMEECKKFGTEEECLMLTNGDGEPRCYFEPLGEYEDCETVWPTTTETPTEPAGCCYGDSYKSNE